MRLTEKDYCGYDIANRKDFEGYNTEEDTEKLFQCLQKLGELEDIEEDIGIDLTTLFKALKQGYIIDLFYREEVRSVDNEQNLLVDFSNKCFYDCYVAGKYNQCYYFDDYGKTWALTKENKDGKDKQRIKSIT